MLQSVPELLFQMFTLIKTGGIGLGYLSERDMFTWQGQVTVIHLQSCVLLVINFYGIVHKLKQIIWGIIIIYLLQFF